MLPDIPKTKTQLLKKLTISMRQYVEDKVPLMRGVRSIAQHEGLTHTYDRFDAPPRTEGYKEHLAKLEIRMDEVPSLVGDALLNKLRGTADEMAALIGQMAVTTLEQGTQEVGNVVDGQGQPLSQEHYLAMLDRILMDFDERGQPTFKIHAHPTLAAALRTKLDEWEQDRSFRQRRDAIMQRQRLEWRDRESDRKLVD